MQICTLLVVTWEKYYSWSVLVKSLCFTAEIPVLAQKEGSHLNSILVMGHCIDEGFTLEVIHRYGTWKLVKIPIFWLQSTPVVCSYRKRISLGRIWNFFFRNRVSSSNFAHSSVAKPRPSTENFVIKESLLLFSQLFFTTTIPMVWKEVLLSLLCFISTIMS